MSAADTDYTLIIITEDGTQYDISEFVTDLGWTENEKELAACISFTAGTENDNLREKIKIGCVVAVLTDGTERVRAIINKAKVKTSNDKASIAVTAYDELYSLQTSEDQYYFPAGQSTKTVLTQILGGCGISISNYTGADVTHERLVFRSGSIADTVLDILDDAEKKGGAASIIRATQGAFEVVPKGSNTTVYLFDEDDTISAEQETSITDLVTRVKIVGQDDKTTGIPPVEATLNGLTQFGVRQKIYQREKDKTAAEAQTAAQKILNEKGIISKTQSIQAPDMPELRKGDVVQVNIGELTGSFYVSGIEHDADGGTMTLNIKPCAAETVSTENGTPTQEEKKEYKVGDIVNFAGGTHYISSYSGAKGYSAKAGPAKITKDPTCAGNGGAHPWHLIHTDSTSNVYGWVDEGTFS